MPLVPEIALAARPPQVQGYDPSKILLTAAQIQDMQNQAYLRNLQAAQLQTGLQEYQDIRAPGGPLEQLRALNQPQTTVPPTGTPLSQLATPTTATASPAAGPMREASTLATAPPSSTLAQMPPEDQQRFAEIATRSQQGGADGSTAPAQSPGPAQTSIGPTQAPPQPSAPGQPRSQNLLDTINQRQQLLQDMTLRFPIHGAAIAKQLTEMDTANLNNQKTQLELQKTSLQTIAESVDAIEKLPLGERERAWQERFGALAAAGFPGAAQLPAQYDPQRARAMALNARTAQQRVEEQQKDLELAIRSYEAGTGRTQAETGRMTEQRLGGTVKVQEGAQGPFLYKEFQPGTPTATPMTAPGGERVLPKSAGEYDVMYDENQNPVLVPKSTVPGQPIRPRRVAPQQQTPPGLAAGTPAPTQPGQPPTPTTPPGKAPLSSQAGGRPQTTAPVSPPASPAAPTLMTPEMQKGQLQPGLTVKTNQLEEARTQADTARETLQTLDQLKERLHGKYDESLFAKNLGSSEAQKAAIALGKDPETVANTAVIQQLTGQLLKAEQGGKGIRANENEIKALKQAAGELGGIYPKRTALEMVDALRQRAKDHLRTFNDLVSQQPPAARPAPYSMAQTMSRDDFLKNYADVKAQRPETTIDGLALFYERNGIHVQGAY